ncbi:MAG TPA: CoB--CoM heterodisulfide reductase iron-sulfur subunit A family protein [Bryobacteraceae bacterium]|nr:CoB--CoM heterodisulfide reductase iron-sulfur subunit A family protein [Bryobacteraceae bacterium]
MRVGVYFCACGSSVSEKVDYDAVARSLSLVPEVAYVHAAEFLCSEEGKEWLRQDLTTNHPDRVVIAACSPREIETAFMQVAASAGLNPFLLQIANIREQVAWVTPDPQQATAKACAVIHSAVARVCRHEPLERKELDACRDVLIVGAGPAGLKAALCLAEAGRRVVLVEKAPALGGLPVRYEELFPTMECGPCLLEPVMGEVLHGEHAHRIEILTLAELVAVKGYYGNFTVTVRQAPRFVDGARCVGCGACIPPCPAVAPNEFNYRLDECRAISLPFAGALPNVPFLTPDACLRWNGQDCDLCRAACPVEGAVVYDDVERVKERNVGAIVVAVGATLYDCSRMPELGYGSLPGVYTSLEFERLLARNGPSGGDLLLPDGTPPASVAIVHCVGSLDERHQPYCSGVCCAYAFKFNHLVRKRLPASRIHHLFKELVLPGKEEFALYHHASGDSNTHFVRYGDLADLRVMERNGRRVVQYCNSTGEAGELDADLVVLCPAIVGGESSAALGKVLDTAPDRFGFFTELHGRTDAAQSKVKGVYLAGACQAPMDIRGAMGQGMAAAAYILSGLAEGRKLTIEPVSASVNEEACSGCRVCGGVCPYKAIDYSPERQTSSVNALLCHGCGTCVAACPAGAIEGRHFTNQQILAEMEAIFQ